VVENAIEATPEDGEVCVTMHRNGPWAEVTVEDNGQGMDPRFVESELFVPFETTKGITGMGIGAYQAREYVRSLGGDVNVASAPNQGTRFTMKFPCVEAA
jgi:signal transduction histidine kinase